MQQIFTEENPTDGIFEIKGQDAHHLKRVVRLKTGEKIRVTSGGLSYLCEISSFTDDDTILATIIDEIDDSELKNKIYLFQALPKGDRMETVIEKCVELGIYEIIPVEMKNCIVKLDDKKKKSRLLRYNAIAESAAKQSKRSLVPKVLDFMSYDEAVRYANNCQIKLFPYESKNKMADTYEAVSSIKSGDSIAVFIGPEGGFAPDEVDAAYENGFNIISLGKRILRTDTAAICTLSMLMLKCEEFLQ